MLWDDADKKYGYINNFTGEVTQEYPTGNKPKKQTKLETESYRKNVVDLNKGMFLKIFLHLGTFLKNSPKSYHRILLGLPKGLPKGLSLWSPWDDAQNKIDQQ